MIPIRYSFDADFVPAGVECLFFIVDIVVDVRLDANRLGETEHTFDFCQAFVLGAFRVCLASKFCTFYLFCRKMFAVDAQCGMKNIRKKFLKNKKFMRKLQKKFVPIKLPTVQLKFFKITN